MTEPTTRNQRRAGRWTAVAALLGVLGAALLVVGLQQTRGSGASPARVPESRAAAPAAAAPSARPPARGVGRTSPGSNLTALPSSVPTEVRIPAIDVRTPLIGLGLDGDGAMQVPQGPRPAGWFTGAPTPGALGPAVVAGHVTWNGEDGVFRRLAEVRRGDRVEVDRKDGRTAVFTVTKVASYDKDRFPTNDVYGNVKGAALRLITCGGIFDGDRYSENVVVYADLVAS